MPDMSVNIIAAQSYLWKMQQRQTSWQGIVPLRGTKEFHCARFVFEI